MKMMFLPALLALSCCVSVVSAADKWGTVTGQIVVTGEIPAPALLHAKGANIKDAAVCAAVDTYNNDLLIDADSKGLANAFVYLRSAPSKIHPEGLPKDPAKLIFDQKACMFIPHALVVHTGQTIEVLSDDPIAHNTHTNPIKNPQTNVLIAPNTREGMGEKITYKIGERLPTKINCDFHPWMLAYWLIVDHPYAAVTDKDGKFEIKNLPVGEHSFIIWHERVGYLEKTYKVDVKEGDNALEPAEFPVDKLKGDGK